MLSYRSSYQRGMVRASTDTPRSREIFARNLFWILLLVGSSLVSFSAAQSGFVTGRGDNARTAANVNETLLTPGNVNKNNFGRLFSQPVDYQVLGQPLYMPNVNIPGRGTHNVVFVVTMLDSVYAFDADDNVGGNSQPLWQVNFTDPANGIAVASYINHTLPCTNANSTGPGFNQEGIVSTPVIDAVSGTMYVVAKTVENGTVHHRLHALDITNGQEKFGGSVVISATSTSNKGHVTNFNSLHQKNRPGLLLLNGVVYIGFGSNYCNDSNTGWVLAYDASTLQQVGSFNTSPDHGLASIWQTGQGLAADEGGSIYAVTAESTDYDVPNGGQSYSDSVLKFDDPSLLLTDYFTPGVVAYLNSHDLDLSSGGPVILPDQDGPYPHLLVVAGKQGTIYVLNRDSLGFFSVNDSQIPQELPFAVGPMFSSPAYWNGMLYYGGDADVLKAFSVSSGLLSSSPVITSSQKMPGAHSPSISANGNTNGILWVVFGGLKGGQLWAFDAATLKLLYTSNQVKTRDALPPIAHFITQTVANGRVYVATRTSLEVYGLFLNLALVSGANQSATVLTALPAPIQLQVGDPYTGVGTAGVPVSFSDGGKGGTFNPPSAVSDDSGNVSTSYTFPQTAGDYTITASSANAGNLSFTETALPGSPTSMVISSGNQQSGQGGSILPKQLAVKIKDAYNNGIPGITATFVDQSHAGTLLPSTAVSNVKGIAAVNYQLPNTAGTYKLSASALALTPAKFTEYAAGNAPANLIVVSGNNQTAKVNAALPQSLVVQVTDQGGNPIAGVSAIFSAPSGTFAGNPATTDSNGDATVNYTTGTSAGAITITASVNSLNTQITANVTAGPATTVTVSGGNNQAGTAGTTLPQPLTVVVTDQYGNPVPGVAVNFDDGGAGGSFLNPNPVTTDNTGTATQGYTLPPAPGTVNITATAAGVPTPAVFSETAQ
jgi:hypothetical protein